MRTVRGLGVVPPRGGDLDLPSSLPLQSAGGGASSGPRALSGGRPRVSGTGPSWRRCSAARRRSSTARACSSVTSGFSPRHTASESTSTSKTQRLTGVRVPFGVVTKCDLRSLSTNNYSGWTIQLGMTRRNSHSFFGQTIKVKTVLQHPDYNMAHDNDVALFQVGQRSANLLVSPRPCRCFPIPKLHFAAQGEGQVQRAPAAGVPAAG